VRGTRHCFNNIADSKDGFLSLKAMDKVIAIDPSGLSRSAGVSPTSLLISEIRTIAADTVWMSPCYDQNCVTIHFTWKPDWPAVSRLLPVIDKEVAPFNACPHWGKPFTTSPVELNKRRCLSSLNSAGSLIRLANFATRFLNRNIFGS
jgi:alditol oxidase